MLLIHSFHNVFCMCSTLPSTFCELLSPKHNITPNGQPDHNDVWFEILELHLQGSKSKPGRAVVAVEAVEILVLLWCPVSKPVKLKSNNQPLCYWGEILMQYLGIFAPVYLIIIIAYSSETRLGFNFLTKVSQICGDFWQF